MSTSRQSLYQALAVGGSPAAITECGKKPAEFPAVFLSWGNLSIHHWPSWRKRDWSSVRNLANGRTQSRAGQTARQTVVCGTASAHKRLQTEMGLLSKLTSIWLERQVDYPVSSPSTGSNCTTAPLIKGALYHCLNYLVGPCQTRSANQH